MKGPGFFSTLPGVFSGNKCMDDVKVITEAGFSGIELPAWDSDCIDIEIAAASKMYCEDYAGKLAESGMSIVSLFALQGQMTALHPAFSQECADFHPSGLSGESLVLWAQDQVRKSIQAALNLGCSGITVLAGGLLRPFLQSYPPLSEELTRSAYRYLFEKWKPLLDIAFEEGIRVNFKIHAGTDLCDDISFAQFLDTSGEHRAIGATFDPSHFLIQGKEFHSFLASFSDRINCCHFRDLEVVPLSLVGTKEAVCIGYNPSHAFMQAFDFYRLDAVNRHNGAEFSILSEGFKNAVRYMRIGDGGLDFTRIYKVLSEAGFDGWVFIEADESAFDLHQAAAWYALMERKLLGTAAA